MLDRKADATMRVAVLVPTSVVPMPAVPMTGVMLVVRLRDAVLIKVAVPTRAAMCDAHQKPDAMRDAVLDPTSVVLMLDAMPDVRPRGAVLSKVAVPTRAVMSAAHQKPDAIRDAVPVLDPTSVAPMPVVLMLVVLMLGAMPGVRLRDAARKARSRDDRHSKACVLRSTCWTETMMAKSAATKS